MATSPYLNRPLRTEAEARAQSHRALELWAAADAETDEAARQTARQIAREKRDAAIAKAKGGRS